MKAKEKKMVTPEPYFKIAFGCSNRNFYAVKQELYDIANEIGIEIQDGYITEKCDFEGDLETIIIYGDERGRQLRDKVLHHYDVTESIDDNTNVHLSIF